MKPLLSRRTLTAGLIGLPAALALPAHDLSAGLQPKPPRVECERYLAFLQQEVRAVLAEMYPDTNPAHLPVGWVPEGFEHPEGPAMGRAAAVIAASKAKPQG